MPAQNYDTFFTAIRQKCQLEHWCGPDMDDPYRWDKYDKRGNGKIVFTTVKKLSDHPQHNGFAYPLCWLLRTSVRKIEGLCQSDPLLPLPSRRDRCTHQENREQTSQCSANMYADASATRQRDETFSSFYGKKTG